MSASEKIMFQLRKIDPKFGIDLLAIKIAFDTHTRVQKMSFIRENDKELNELRLELEELQKQIDTKKREAQCVKKNAGTSKRTRVRK